MISEFDGVRNESSETVEDTRDAAQRVIDLASQYTVVHESQGIEIIVKVDKPRLGKVPTIIEYQHTVLTRPSDEITGIALMQTEPEKYAYYYVHYQPLRRVWLLGGIVEELQHIQ